MRRLGVLVILAGALVTPAASQTGVPDARRLRVGVETTRLDVTRERYLAHVKFLSSDELEGRGNGTAGLERAADYIASEFGKAGLEPGGDAGSYFQTFAIGPRLEPDPQTALALTTRSGTTAFKLGAQFHPLSVVADGEPDLSGQRMRSAAGVAMAFAGYGISAPGLGYDDYQGLDVSGKAVVVFTHEPQEHDPGSIFEGDALTAHSDLAQKATQAARHGARVLVLVEDPSHVRDRAMAPGWLHDPQIDALGIPVVRVERLRLDRTLEEIDFAGIAKDIDRDLKPRSRPLAATLSYTEAFVRTNPRVRNVVGVLRGAIAARATEAIVIGAHYDHLGLGGRFSRAPQSVAEIHNGADDNASGTAAVVEMARVAAVNRRRFRRTVIFAAFAGEEIGLLGSTHYVAHPPIPLGATTAMINLDMIGRANGRVMVGGADRNAEFRQLVDELRPLSPLRLDGFEQGYQEGASDDASFLRFGVPVLAFFTGFHDDYHRPSDDWPRVDANGGASIATLALAIAERLAR